MKAVCVGLAGIDRGLSWGFRITLTNYCMVSWLWVLSCFPALGLPLLSYLVQSAIGLTVCEQTSLVDWRIVGGLYLSYISVVYIVCMCYSL